MPDRVKGVDMPTVVSIGSGRAVTGSYAGQEIAIVELRHGPDRVHPHTRQLIGLSIDEAAKLRDHLDAALAEVGRAV
jgi:hypothetical protein